MLKLNIQNFVKDLTTRDYNCHWIVASRYPNISSKSHYEKMLSLDGEILNQELKKTFPSQMSEFEKVFIQMKLTWDEKESLLEFC